MKIQETQILKYTTVIVFLIYSHILCSQPDGYQSVNSQTEVVNYLEKYATEVKSIQSDFKQEKHLEYLDVALQSGGKFWFKSPDKVSWVYSQPYNYTMILNSGKLMMISDKSNIEMDMKGNAIFEQVNNLMLSAVNGNVFGNKDYSVKSYENESNYLLMLKPNSPALNEMIKEIHLFFEKNRSVVTKIKLIESESDYSIISFSNLKINEAFDNKVFNP